MLLAETYQRSYIQLSRVSLVVIVEVTLLLTQHIVQALLSKLMQQAYTDDSFPPAGKAMESDTPASC
jgi:hypothetical protein